MARVQLLINDPANAMTMKAMLEAEGHVIVDQDPEAAFSDDSFRAIETAKRTPTLLLARVSELREAVAAMKQGVFGYIFIPFLPGEAGLMIQRALRQPSTEEAIELLSMEEMEERHILNVLRLCKKNQGKAAKMLKIGRNTLWRKLTRMKTKGMID